ncbi:hypothetical protein OG275_17780 [Streptomyces niveus]|uniref:DUF4145 domain-containing protein n=1 Tax=Streptomyces niveus TaxID=193462 RepID=A0ABZ2A986_STRNV|nr:hypothetical protein [Streptomyces niveus]
MDDSLSYESFYQGAKKAAHKAMDDHGRPEYDEFALHAGVAVEKLAKAALAAKNPVYVAEIRSNSADMIMYLGGHVQLDEEKVRSVGATEAIKRLRKIGVLKVDPDLDLLIEMRNGAVHAAPDSTLAKGMISPLARTIETLLSDISRPLDDFWGRWTKAVKDAVDEQRDAVFQDVQLRISQARHRLEDRLEGLPLPKEIRFRPKMSGFSFFFVAGNPDGDGDIVSVTGGAGCPACGREAQVTVEPSSGKGAVAVALTCPWCQLHLNGPEEIEASNADLDISLEVAEAALYGDYD